MANSLPAAATPDKRRRVPPADAQRHPAEPDVFLAARLRRCYARPDDMDIEEIFARESIRDLVARYAHCADSGRFDELAGLFATDGALQTPDGTEHRGRAAIRELLGGTKDALAGATRAAWIRHHVSNLRIEVGGPDAATGAAYFFVVTERGPDHWGRYRDRYVRADGVWLFAHRRVGLDGYAPGSWVAERRGG